jgi:hypothetical protein
MAETKNNEITKGQKGILPIGRFEERMKNKTVIYLDIVGCKITDMFFIND